MFLFHSLNLSLNPSSGFLPVIEKLSYPIFGEDTDNLREMMLGKFLKRRE